MSFLSKIEADTLKVVDTKAALECVNYVLEHEEENFLDYAAHEGVESAEDDAWRTLPHVYVQALIAVGEKPTFKDGVNTYDVKAGYQLSLIKAPSGKYSFVGDVPNNLAFDKELPPEIANEISTSSNPALVMKKYKVTTPTFKNVKEALQFARKRGVKESDIDVTG